ncbi:hypothetical protein FLJC2902T_21750 [Flavobacterium limnosediminis JC2902]|uniref:DUF2231 domain-containing protein n=1 Tax=Flavobacterium limnosediminis JC2902 TaxID=1341181 RepID=V6SKU1_9FLAO|nr:DUF2231 domain-containing protein [Flavobacterium limnosediminis]ESU27201.1 hypothetical protein FLJC2902T_21750 [Flavobacterium limnosediminis JC2902]
MNDAHLHMLVNHFPIIGTIFGLGILIAGVFFKNDAIKNTAYILFVVAAIFGFASMNTGEGAEELAEKLPSVTHEIIHEHEEIAEKLALVLYALGAVSLLGLFLNIKKHAKANMITYLAIVIAAVGVFLAQKTGTTGGEIRHTEIRENAAAIAGSTQETTEPDHNDNH